ncbi:DNA polymerase III subunit alpha [bacterium]|nr:DNA polymerase III subunit alpha [bacterium]
MRNEDFVHLNIRTPFSFYEGASVIPELVDAAVQLNHTAIAFTDRNRTNGLVRGYKAAKEKGLKPVLGLTLDDPADASRYLLIWAKDLQGYGELNRLASKRLLEPQFSLDEAVKTLDDSTIVATGDCDLLSTLMEILPRGSVYGELILPSDSQDRRQMRDVYEFCRGEAIPMLVTGSVGYANRAQQSLHSLLKAIGERQVLRRSSAKLNKVKTRPIFDDGELLKAYRSLPEALMNSRLITEQCNVDLRLGELKFPRPLIDPDKSLFLELKERSEHGLRERYGEPLPMQARERLAYELGVIDHLGYTSYMLVVHDIALDAWSRGVRTLGRGSAANSIVCYCLKLTDICPLRYNLYFERFLNPERTSPPDVDLDFSWRDRDEILQNVYDTYGDDHVAMISTTVTFRARGALHEAALARGIPEDEIMRITRRVPSFSRANRIEDLPEEAPECKGLPLNREPWRSISRDANRLIGFPRHLSIHAGGIVITPDPITKWTALEMASKGFVVTQYDMYGIEDLGLVKIDLLSQRALGVLKEAVIEIEENTGEKAPVDNVEGLFEDSKTWELIRTGKSMGCFYIESSGMQALLKKLNCDNYELLVAASSVIRPGVSESGMMQQYIECVRDPSKAEYLHPKMRDMLKETHGVMIYQEDVIKVAHHIAGISLGRADSLRRAMSGKSRSLGEMSKMEDEFLEGCRKNGVTQDIAKEIWRQMASFAGYAFCKAHSASFAVLSVQIAYLRAHHPAEFMAAVLANGGGYYSQAAYIEEAKRMGLRILLPDINRSREEHSGNSSIGNGAIQLGFKGIGALREETVHRILEMREDKGEFKGFEEFMRQVRPARDETEALICCGGFDQFGKNRPTLLRRMRAGYETLVKSNSPLIEGSEDVFALMPDAPDWTDMEKYARERRILGYSPSKHPLQLLELDMSQALPAVRMEQNVGRRATMIGWVFSQKKISTRTKKEGMKFLSAEDLTGAFEVTVFPRVYKKYAPLLLGNGPFRITGNVEDEQGVCTLIAQKIELA